MVDQVFEGMAVFGFPRPGDGKDKGPLTVKIHLISPLNHLHILFGTIGCIPTDDNQFRPGRRGKLSYHLAKQRIFVSVVRMRFGKNQAEGYRNAIHIPLRHQQPKADAEKPRMMLTFSTFLRHRILLAPFGSFTAVPPQVEYPVFRRRKTGQHFLRPPREQQVDTPIAGFEQTPKSPVRDPGRRPTGQLFQGLSTRINRLQENQPAQQQTVTAFPHPRHAAKQRINEPGHVGKYQHQSIPPAQGITGYSFSACLLIIPQFHPRGARLF